MTVTGERAKILLEDVDFTDVKRELGNWIDDNLDHRMVLCEDDPAVPMMRELGEPMFLLPSNPTAENIAQLIFNAAIKRSLPIDSVRLWEKPRCFATYERPSG